MPLRLQRADFSLSRSIMNFRPLAGFKRRHGTWEPGPSHWEKSLANYKHSESTGCSPSYNQPSDVGRHFPSPQCSVPFMTRGSFSLQPPHFDVKKASQSLASPTCGCATAWRDNHPGQSGFLGQIQMEAAQSLNENLEIFFWGYLSQKQS